MADQKKNQKNSPQNPVSAELENARADLEANTALLKRVQADFENFMKRAEKEQAASARRTEARFLADLLPVLDTLVSARKAAPNDRGLEGVASQFQKTLAAHGLEKIETQNGFNPEEHECMMKKSDKGKPDNAVLDVVQEGYRAAGTVLRPARVVVNEKPTQGE